MRTYAGIISAFYDKNKALVKHWNKSWFLQMKSLLCQTYLNLTEDLQGKVGFVLL